MFPLARKSRAHRPNPWVARLVVLALLHQVAFFLFAFAARADAGTGLRVPLCTGQGIVWIDAGDARGFDSPSPDPGAGGADHRMCPLCAPLAASAPAAKQPFVPASFGRAVFTLPRDGHPVARADGPRSARAPPS